MSRMGSTPVLSLPHPNSWSQVIEHISGETQFFAVLTVLGKDAKNVGKSLLQTIHSTSLNSAEECYELLLESVRTAQDARTSLQMASVHCSGSTVVFAAVRGSVLLKRAGTVGKVLVADEQVQVRVGQSQPEDTVILATEVSGFFLQEVEQKFAQGFQTDTVITSLIPGVQAAGEQQCAMAFVSAQPVGKKSTGGAVEETAGDITASQAGTRQLRRLSLSGQGSTDTLGRNSVLKNSVAQKAAVIGSAQNSVVQDVLSQVIEQNATQRQRASIYLAGMKGFAQRAQQILSSILTGVKKTGVVVLELGRQAYRSHPFTSAVYVGDQRRKKVLRLVVVGVSVVVVLAVLGWWLVRSREQANQEAQAVVAPFSQELEAAEALVATEPLVARERVATTIAQLEEALRQEQLSSVTKKALELELSKAQELTTSISGKKELAELPVFYDLRLIQSDFVATLAQGVGEKAVFVDRDKKQAAVLNLENKQLTMLSLDAVGAVRSVVLLGDQLFVLADGVWTVSLVPDAQAQNSIPAGDSNTGGQFIGAYESYVYVVNPEKRNIYRYLKQEGGYSEPVGWLASSLGSSLTEVGGLAIDGDVWLATQQGEINKYTSGRQQDFIVNGLSEPFDSPLQVVTSVGLQNLYVLEPDHNRVVVLSKEGTFLREIKNTALGSASALVVSESLGKAFVLSGSLVFEVAL